MSESDALPPDEVIDAADDDLVDIDGAPTDPLSAVLGSGGFDFGSLLEQASAMQAQMVEAQQRAADTLLEGVAGGGVVRVTITGAFEPTAVAIDPAAVDPDDVEMLQDLVLAALRHAVDQVNDLQRGALGGGLDLPGLDLGGLGLGGPGA
jgi:DNA-binding YbaB/EbfC family protein